jgi:lysozyme
MNMLPNSHPMAKQAVVEALAVKALAQAGHTAIPPFFLVGVRGYYLDTMGAAGKNDRGIYDDAIFVVGPDTFASFNANTDPSAWRSGVASLLPGVHWYRPGNHGITRPGGGYPAFRPATKGEELPVKRDGEASVPSKTPGVAINIHKGGFNTTSSLGCQTIHPSQWDAFHALATMQLKRTGMKVFPYILIDGPIA